MFRILLFFLTLSQLYRFTLEKLLFISFQLHKTHCPTSAELCDGSSTESPLKSLFSALEYLENFNRNQSFLDDEIEFIFLDEIQEETGPEDDFFKNDDNFIFLKAYQNVSLSLKSISNSSISRIKIRDLLFKINVPAKLSIRNLEIVYDASNEGEIRKGI